MVRALVSNARGPVQIPPEPSTAYFLLKFFKSGLFARPISMPFLKSPGHELSEYMFFFSGKSFFASLDIRDV